MCTSSLATLPLWTISGTVSQFTWPSNGICPGDDVTFTCVVNTTSVIIWTVNSGGDEESCNYRHNDRNTDTCGPGDIFTSSVTDMNGDPRNSSLSADSITSGLSGTSVTCFDRNANIIGSRDICVIGKMYICVSYSPLSLWLWIIAFANVYCQADREKASLIEAMWCC